MRRLNALQAVLPCAEYYKRQGFPLKKIVEFASNRDFSDLLVFNEDRKEVRQGYKWLMQLWAEAAVLVQGASPDFMSQSAVFTQ